MNERVRRPAFRLAPLLAWVLLLALGIAFIARSTFTADLSAFLPEHPDARQRLLIEQLQVGVASRTLMIGIAGGDAATRAQASKAVAQAMRESRRFEQVQNGERSDFADAARLVVEHRYQLSPDMNAAHFTAEGLRDAIEDTLSLLGTPAGGAVKPLLERDPTGETQRIAEALLPAEVPRSEEGVWVSRKAARAVLLATTRAQGSDLDAQAEAMGTVRKAFAPWQARGLELQMTGAPMFSVDSRARIEHEVVLLALVGTLVIGCLLVVAFGSLRALGVALLPVVTGVVAGVSAVSLVFGNVHGITLAFGSTLIGEAVDYAIYYLIQARSGAAREAGWRAWLRENWPTVRLGLLTSICGFAALLFSGFPGLQQLGVFSIAGLAGGALATRFVLPVLAPDGAPGLGLRRRLGLLAARGAEALPHARMLVLALAVAAVALLAWRWGSLWEGSIGSLSPVPAQAQALDHELREDLGASDAGVMAVVSGADVEHTLQAAEAAAAQLDALVEQGRLAGYDSPARFLPSEAMQRARLQSIPDGPVLAQRLAEATRGGPLPAARLAPFLADAERARHAPPLTRASLEGSALASAVDAMLVPRKAGGWSALIPLRLVPGQDAAASVRAALSTLPPAFGAQVVAIKPELDSLYAHYLHEALTQACIGALAVVALLAVQLRSWRRLLRVCVPLLLAVLFTLAGSALLGGKLGILHLVGLLLVIAVGSNYGLYVDQLQVDGEADDDTLASLLLANLTTVVSFSLIALSEIPALSAIGRVVAPGALLALLLSAVLARPGFVRRKVPDSAPIPPISP